MAEDSDGAADPVPTLSAKHRRFVAEFLVDYNASAAARRAGYSERSAKVSASKLMARPYIAEAIRRAELELLDQLGVTGNRMLIVLGRIATADGKALREMGCRGSDLRKAAEFLQSRQDHLADIEKGVGMFGAVAFYLPENGR